MKTRLALLCGAAILCALTGCYNNPRTSLKKPGEGPQAPASGPAVGPGTVAGGSTAGPQPVKHDAGDHSTKTGPTGNATHAKADDHGGDHTPAPKAKH